MVLQVALMAKLHYTTTTLAKCIGFACMQRAGTWRAGWYSGVHKARGRAGAGGRCGWHCAIDGGLQTQSSWTGHGHSGHNGGQARSRQGGWCLHFHLSHALSLLKQLDLALNNLSQSQYLDCSLVGYTKKCPFHFITGQTWSRPWSHFKLDKHYF